MPLTVAGGLPANEAVFIEPEIDGGSYGDYAGSRGLPRSYGVTLRVDF